VSSVPQALARFGREMQALGKLEHPNLARALDADEYGGKHFLVLEYVDGADLAAIVRQNGPLQIADACEAIRQAASALDYIHTLGLVHRDIKPANLMVGKDGCVKLLDLGLALLRREFVSGELTQVGQLMGTADYMAPEQALDAHQVDGRTDIYSLGCTLYFLLCGQPPFSGAQYDTVGKKLLAQTTIPIRPIQNARPDIPPALGAALERMLAKDPHARFSTAREVIEALHPFTTGCDLRGLAGRSGKPALGAEEAAATVRLCSSPLAPTRPINAPVAAQDAAAGPPGAPATAKPAANRWRRSATAVALLGIGLLMLLAIFIHIHHPNGKETEVAAPAGSKVAVSENGDVHVTVKAEDRRPQAEPNQPPLPPRGRGVGDAGPPPPLAKPSMSATEAARVQTQWAAYLGAPVKQTNSIGV
jgi:hypothetical protein